MAFDPDSKEWNVQFNGNGDKVKDEAFKKSVVESLKDVTKNAMIGYDKSGEPVFAQKGSGTGKQEGAVYDGFGNYRGMSYYNPQTEQYFVKWAGSNRNDYQALSGVKGRPDHMTETNAINGKKYLYDGSTQKLYLITPEGKIIDM